MSPLLPRSHFTHAWVTCFPSTIEKLHRLVKSIICMWKKTWCLWKKQDLILSGEIGIFMCTWKNFLGQCLNCLEKLEFSCATASDFLYRLGKLHIGLLGLDTHVFQVTNQFHSLFFSVRLFLFGIELCQLIFAGKNQLAMLNSKK